MDVVNKKCAELFKFVRLLFKDSIRLVGICELNLWVNVGTLDVSR